jgi:predicted nucleic acid-binding protein
VNAFVVDASVVIKWVVEEDGTAAALAVRRRAALSAPELLIPECANILWKKTQRGEMTKETALLAARLLERAEIELCPTRMLLEPATRLAIELDHSAYDCLYLALAVERGCQFVTADERIIRKIHQGKRSGPPLRAISLAEAASGG